MPEANPLAALSLEAGRAGPLLCRHDRGASTSTTAAAITASGTWRGCRPFVLAACSSRGPVLDSSRPAVKDAPQARQAAPLRAAYLCAAHPRAAGLLSVDATRALPAVWTISTSQAIPGPTFDASSARAESATSLSGSHSATAQLSATADGLLHVSVELRLDFAYFPNQCSGTTRDSQCQLPELPAPDPECKVTIAAAWASEVPPSGIVGTSARRGGTESSPSSGSDNISSTGSDGAWGVSMEVFACSDAIGVRATCTSGGTVEIWISIGSGNTGSGRGDAHTAAGLPCHPDASRSALEDASAVLAHGRPRHGYRSGHPGQRFAGCTGSSFSGIDVRALAAIAGCESPTRIAHATSCAAQFSGIVGRCSASETQALRHMITLVLVTSLKVHTYACKM